MSRRFKRPPRTEFLRRAWQRATIVPAGEDGQPLVDVMNGLLQRRCEISSFLNVEDFLQCSGPCLVLVGSPPGSELSSKRPHGEGEACKTKSFLSEFEELSIAERRMILLLVHPVFCQQPLDESLGVPLGDHAHGSECCVKAGDFA